MPSFTHPGPYQKIGTSCVYGHGVACVRPPVRKDGCWLMIWMSPLRSRRRPLHVRRRISCGAWHAIFANGARFPSCETEKLGVVEPTTASDATSATRAERRATERRRVDLTEPHPAANRGA